MNRATHRLSLIAATILALSIALIRIAGADPLPGDKCSFKTCSVLSLTVTGPATGLTFTGVATNGNAIDLGTSTQRLKGGASSTGWLNFDSAGYLNMGEGISLSASKFYTMASGNTLLLRAAPTDIATAVGLNLGMWSSSSNGLLYTAGSKIAGFYNGLTGVGADRSYIDRDGFFTGGVSALGGVAVSQLATPVNATLATVTTGGTLAAATYYYRISATNAFGETLASTETSVVTTGATSLVRVRWTVVPGATGYKVYGRSTGAELLMATIPYSDFTNLAVNVTTSLQWTDTGSVTPSGALPTVNTTGGYQASAVTSITAKAGGGQATATPLGAETNFVTTVGSVADSVLLPGALLGRHVVVFNAGANSTNIFPASGAAIDALGANTAYALAAGASREFWGQTTTLWLSR